MCRGVGGWFRSTYRFSYVTNYNNLLPLQVIFYEQDWNPQVDRQALQRAHRIGQMNHVLTINLVTGRTIEEVRYTELTFTVERYFAYS